MLLAPMEISVSSRWFSHSKKRKCWGKREVYLIIIETSGRKQEEELHDSLAGEHKGVKRTLVRTGR